MCCLGLFLCNNMVHSHGVHQPTNATDGKCRFLLIPMAFPTKG